MNKGVHTFFRYFPVSARDRRWGLVADDGGGVAHPHRRAIPAGGYPGAYSFDWSKAASCANTDRLYLRRQGGSKPGAIVAGGFSPAMHSSFPGHVASLSAGPGNRWDEHWSAAMGRSFGIW